ncbi:hypothetical protein NQ036_12355 [Brevibacterium sp. 91QC2O2]|uniref:hypothetical protein n=2 Tax=unclassified Brevibacterium TaxID=2614124 RepID=UPI00211C8C22|nr:hypothetical protein [Brevibacterium sp. 91QC2O2]MCQ9369030.1 hypothetical protein [Brevibacterium sp. 91QC2O2]
MAGRAGYTAEEIRELVAQYQAQPHGTKALWLAEQPFTVHQFRRLRQMVYEGDVDRELIPREHGGMTRTHGQLAAFERARAKELAEHELEVARLQARIEQLEGSNEALGKAIGLLHRLSGQEPDTATTTDSQDSSQPKTDS